MRSTLSVSLMVAACVLPNPVPASSQDTGCDYAECALRVENGQLVAGAGGVTTGSITGWAPDVRILLNGPVEARIHAEAFLKHSRRADWYGIAAGAFVVSLQVAERLGDDPFNLDQPRRSLIVTLGVPALYSGLLRGRRHDRTAQRALARSVWTYNASLADRPDGITPERVNLDGGLWDVAPIGLGAVGWIIGYSAGRDRLEDAGAGAILGSTVGLIVGSIQMRLSATQ